MTPVQYYKCDHCHVVLDDADKMKEHERKHLQRECKHTAFIEYNFEDEFCKTAKINVSKIVRRCTTCDERTAYLLSHLDYHQRKAIFEILEGTRHAK